MRPRAAGDSVQELAETVEVKLDVCQTPAAHIPLPTCP